MRQALNETDIALLTRYARQSAGGVRRWMAWLWWLCVIGLVLMLLLDGIRPVVVPVLLLIGSGVFMQKLIGVFASRHETIVNALASTHKRVVRGVCHAVDSDGQALRYTIDHRFYTGKPVLTDRLGQPTHPLRAPKLVNVQAIPNASVELHIAQGSGLLLHACYPHEPATIKASTTIDAALRKQLAKQDWQHWWVGPGIAGAIVIVLLFVALPLMGVRDFSKWVSLALALLGSWLAGMGVLLTALWLLGHFMRKREQQRLQVYGKVTEVIEGLVTGARGRVVGGLLLPTPTQDTARWCRVGGF